MGAHAVVIYQDEMGYISVIVDNHGIDFSDGCAVFSDADGKDYKVPVGRLFALRLM